MTTNMQSKFRTDFSTLGELWEIWLSPPEEIKAWAELLVPEQLEIGNENNRTVAHQLAACGALPAKFLTPEILWIADESDNTVAGDYTAWAAENNRWDLMNDGTFSLRKLLRQGVKHTRRFSYSWKTGCLNKPRKSEWTAFPE